ncbi:MAG TPA: class I SAM-dependent methyltransferase [Croceibacterium sp.]|nr:class I SAM-dependent methyltransferase [Croceibacterium sp.]
MGVFLSPAALAFDAMASNFDAKFDPLLSVAAQRAAVRKELLAAFPAGSRLLEIGGGTGTDAAWLLGNGRDAYVTDASPKMIAEAARKVGLERVEAIAAEDLGNLADRGQRFDGAFSNFAALNCVRDLAPVGAALGRLVRPGGELVLVLFGTWSPGECIVEAARGRFTACFRRLKKGPVPASLRGRKFKVRYYRRRDIEHAMAPHFRLVGKKAIGLFVPPSAAEPWISRHPRVLSVLEALDTVLARPLAAFGDHVLYRFERTGALE